MNNATAEPQHCAGCGNELGNDRFYIRGGYYCITCRPKMAMREHYEAGEVPTCMICGEALIEAGGTLRCPNRCRGEQGA